MYFFFFLDKPCDLQCIPRDGKDIEVIGVFVADGTPCRQSTRDMCIAGQYKINCIVLRTVVDINLYCTSDTLLHS